MTSLPTSPTHRRGSVIVVILVLIALAATLMEQFIERATTEMLIESRVKLGDRLRGDAHSALEATLAVLADYQTLDHGLQSPAQGWGAPLAGLALPVPPGTLVAVNIEDETGRVSLPHLDAPGLVALGRRLGLPEDKAKELADALLGWTRHQHDDASFETDPRNYERETPPHEAPGRPLESWGELAAVQVARRIFFTPEGRPDEMLARFSQAVSLYDFPAVNLNTAGADALALAGLDEDQVKQVMDFNAGRTARAPGSPPYFRSVAEARTLLGGTVPLTGFDTQARCLRIIVTVREAATSYQLTAVVRLAGGPAPARAAETAADHPGAGDLAYPFKLLALEENIVLSAPRRMNSDPATAGSLVLVPGDRFYVTSVALDPAAAASAQVEVALEESSPFPLSQVYHGFVTSADGTRALAYAAYRRRFTPEELIAWPVAAAVLPDFLALLGPVPGEPGVTIHAQAGGIIGVAWDGKTPLPVATLAQAVPEPTDERVAAMVDELRRLGGLPGTGVRRSGGPIGVAADGSGDVTFRVEDGETFRIPAAAVAGADVRDKNFLDARAREQHRRGLWWAALVVAGLVLALAAGTELAAGAIGAWNHRRQAQVARQDGEVAKIEVAQTVATRVEDLTARQERPLEWLAQAAAVRPRSIQFLRAETRNDRSLTIEVQTDDAADAANYEAVLRRLPGVEQAETHDLRVREGRTTFAVALKFKAAGGTAARGRR